MWRRCINWQAQREMGSHSIAAQMMIHLPMDSPCTNTPTLIHYLIFMCFTDRQFGDIQQQITIKQTMNWYAANLRGSATPIAPKRTLHGAPGKPCIGFKLNIIIDMHLPC